MLESLVDCGHALAIALSEAVQEENRRAVQLQLIEVFQRGFLAVRMGIRLCVTLRAGPKAATAAACAVNPSEHERAEREKPKPPRGETEREREYEAVSLPRFLATLGAVAADAERLGQQLPADIAAHTLPTLSALLAAAETPQASRSAAQSATAVDVLTRPRPPTSKTALLGGASAPPTRPVALAVPALTGPALPRGPPGAYG